jgi:hypothetical protein
MSSEDIFNFNIFLFNQQSELQNCFVLCPLGGLGNVLFQYFFGYSVSKKYNKKIYYQKNYNYWRGDIDRYGIFNNLNFVNLNDINMKNFQFFNEPHFYYNDVNFEDNVSYQLTGQFQSYKYFIDYIDEIKQNLFSNIPSIYNEQLNKYNKIKNNKETCMIHVRRGDYLSYSNVHPVCSNEYYSQGINLIPNCKYLIFSDDLNYIHNWSLIKNIDHEIINEFDAEKTLILMSFCDNFIIANSSLSLAAYYLRDNKNAKIVAPAIWFGKDGLKYKIEDIVPENSFII